MPPVFSRSILRYPSTSLRLFDLTLPLKGGLLDSSRFLERISSILGRDLRLEELEIPIIRTAEDIDETRSTSAREFHRAGRLLRASGLLSGSPRSSPDRRGITNRSCGNRREFTDSIILSTTFYENEELI